MSIRYSGTNKNDLYAGTASATAVMANINTTLTAAGWTILPVNCFSVLTMSGPALNNETVILSIKTYTFKTVINNANDGEVLIGADAFACLTNLKAAINLGAGAGTLYSSATTLSTIATATILQDTGSLNIEQKTAGASLGYGVGETLSAGAFSSNFLNWAGFRAKSALTPQGLNLTWFYFNALEGDIRTRHVISNSSETTFSSSFAAGQILFFGASVDMRIIANPYQFFIMLDGVGTSNGNLFYCAGTPWLPNFLTGTTVTNAVTAAGLVKITTGTAHGLITGDSVTIRGVLGVSPANATNNLVTVIDGSNFTLDGSAFAGAYTSGGRATKVGSQIVEAIWNIGANSGGNMFRTGLQSTGNNWLLLNGSFILNAGASVGNFNLAAVTNITAATPTTELAWFNSSYLVTEPFLVWGTNSASAATINGQMWDAVYVRKPLTKDVTGSFDSHNWWNLTDNWSVSPCGGGILHVVP